MQTIFIPYLLLVVILYILYLIEKGKYRVISKKGAIWTAYIIVFWFIGFRTFIMSDFIVYFNLFKSIPNIFHINEYNFNKSSYEVGFIIYTSLIKGLTSDYFVWVGINTLIDMCVFAFFFKKYCKSMILPLIFFIAFNGLLIEFNLYRNVKGIDCFLLSIPYLQRKKALPYIALNTLGTLFHYSSIIYIPLYFILSREMPKWLIWGGIVVANILFLFDIGIINLIISQLPISDFIIIYNKLAGYQSSAIEVGFSVGYFERLIAILLFSIFYNKLISHNKANIIFYNCFWIYYMSYLVFYEVRVFVERIPMLFIFSYWVLYPALIYVKTRYINLIKTWSVLIVTLKIYSTFSLESARYENQLWATPDYDKAVKIQLIDLKNRDK